MLPEYLNKAQKEWRQYHCLYRIMCKMWIKRGRNCQQCRAFKIKDENDDSAVILKSIPLGLLLRNKWPKSQNFQWYHLFLNVRHSSSLSKPGAHVTHIQLSYWVTSPEANIRLQAASSEATEGFIHLCHIYTLLEKWWWRLFTCTAVIATSLQMSHLDTGFQKRLSRHTLYIYKRQTSKKKNLFKISINLRQVLTFTEIQRIQDQGLRLSCCLEVFTALPF